MIVGHWRQGLHGDEPSVAGEPGVRRSEATQASHFEARAHSENHGEKMAESPSAHHSCWTGERPWPPPEETDRRLWQDTHGANTKNALPQKSCRDRDLPQQPVQDGDTAIEEGSQGCQGTTSLVRGVLKAAVKNEETLKAGEGESITKNFINTLTLIYVVLLTFFLVNFYYGFTFYSVFL